jgi:hypothetical protein
LIAVVALPTLTLSFILADIRSQKTRVFGDIMSATKKEQSKFVPVEALAAICPGSRELAA